MEDKTRNLELELEKAGKTNYETTVTLEAKVRGYIICIFKICFHVCLGSKSRIQGSFWPIMTDEPIVAHRR